MKNKLHLAIRNLTGRPIRTTALFVLTAILSLTVCGGTLLVTSLRSGLHSLESRLGADIMVVPYEATTKASLENIILQGNTGYFYMDNSLMEKIANTEGIGQISAQFFLASTSSGCCSVAVQIIGFDPETDFTITPWIQRSYSKELQTLDIVVGNDLNAFVGDTLTFYGTKCHVAAKLEKTGTYYDTSVFTSKETIQMLIQSSIEQKLNYFDVDPEQVVSCVMINVADGYSVEEVLNDINIHVKKVKAVRTKEMIADISSSLSSVSDMIGVLIAAVWILGIIILFLVFSMNINERKREFAVLRVIGASRRKISALVMQEALYTGLIGGVLGTGIALLGVAAFHQLIEEQLGLPFLLPDMRFILVIAVSALAISILSGILAASVSAGRISSMDTALILRGDN